MPRKLILAGWIAMSTACSVWAATSRYPITAAQVSDAIGSTGTPVSPDAVSLLSVVTASTPAPHLRVQGAERATGDQLMVRIACETPEECLPFVVSLRSSAGTAARLVGLFASGGSPVRAASVVASGPMVIRNGAQAVLLLDGKHVHVQLPVVTLENGAVGQRIRVTEKDKRQTYTAVVVNSGLLQGRL